MNSPQERTRVPRLAAVSLVAALVFFLAACGGAPEISLATWSVEVPGAPPADVHLPTHVALPREPGTYTLRARVDLPPELEGRELSLSVPYWRARIALRAAGAPLDPLDDVLAESYRSRGPHRWRIPADASKGGHLDLELRVANTWSQSGWLDTIPTLSADPRGASRYRLVRWFNDGAASLNVALLWGIGLTYLIIYLFDRRLRAHLFLAIQALGGSYFALFDTGVAQALLGTLDINLIGVAVTVSCTASVYFTHTHFQLGRPPRAFLLAAAAVIAAEALSRNPFTTAVWLGPPIVLLIVSICVYQVFVLGKLALERPPRMNARTLLFAWASFSLGGADFLEWAGAGTVTGGLHGALVATLAFAVVHAIALSREHVRAFQDIERLGAERAEKIKMLEAQQVALEEQKEALEQHGREIQTLNEELRRQVAERSRQLSEALARLTPGRASGELGEGDVIDGRYRITRPLGSGAMGRVFAVERTTDGRRFALKVMTGAQTPPEMARFAREAQIAAQLDHPNLVSILDVGVSATGALYLVMELVAGISLFDAKRRYGEVPWALDVLAQVARGLAAIHARGIVHRDLKPGNILLAGTSDRITVKIADFGIASLPSFDETPAKPDSALDATLAASASANLALTAAGAIVGTPLYMPPELARGAPTAVATGDVYSFGVLAFEALTGRLPFEVPPLVAVLEGRSPHMSSLADAGLPGIAVRVASIVDACLAIDPALRPTATEIARVLGAEERGAEPPRASAHAIERS